MEFGNMPCPLGSNSQKMYNMLFFWDPGSVKDTGRDKTVAALLLEDDTSWVTLPL